MENTAESCPECGGASMVGTDLGMTCMTCGLIIDEGQTFVVQEQLGKEGAIRAHEIFHGNTTTIVGTRRERMVGAGSRLAKLQQRIVTYDETKRSSIYHLVKGVAHGMQLPPGIIDHAVHVCDKLVAIVNRGTFLAGAEMLAALSMYIASKRLGIAIHKDALVDALGLDQKRFDRCLLHVKAAGKVASMPTSRELSKVIFEQVLAATIGIAGEGHHHEAIELAYRTLARAFMGLPEDSIVAVTVYVALQLEGHPRASLAAVSSATGYRSASLYNAAMRVLHKLGIEVEGSLSKVDIGACLREIVPMGSGIMRETPVQVMTVEAPVVETIHAESQVVQVEVPVIKTVPAPRPTMTRTIPVSTNASPSGLVVRRFGVGRPPRNYYTNSNVSSNISRELFIAVRRGRGRPRKNPISPLPMHPPGRPLSPIYFPGSTGPPMVASASPG
ncbi:MAG TPA: hypothetical protein VKM55_10585 [Candidatus Lokiarchaeia archaeon]|nr:hypothetical protein [Candidatus Lokiarchaeia archaeon]